VVFKDKKRRKVGGLGNGADLVRDCACLDYVLRFRTTFRSVRLLLTITNYYDGAGCYRAPV
jgi:hypothetical protein